MKTGIAAMGVLPLFLDCLLLLSQSLLVAVGDSAGGSPFVSDFWVRLSVRSGTCRLTESLLSRLVSAMPG